MKTACDEYHECSKKWDDCFYFGQDPFATRVNICVDICCGKCLLASAWPENQEESKEMKNEE